MREIVIDMPLSLRLGKSADCKEYILNMNQKKHYHTYNNLKKKYQSIVLNKLPDIPRMNLIKLEFTLFRGTLRRIDRSNVLTVHEKFFCDALTASGIIEDDNDKFIKSTLFESGEIDRINPRVEIRVIELESD